MQASDYSDVFVSYRRKDVEFTQKLVESLQAQGKEVWIDWEDIPPGSEGFSDDIRRGLEGADAFIAILSPDYLESTYCVDLELGNAIKMNKKIIPIVLHKFDGYPIPPGIGHINWVYFTPHAGHENTFEESFPKVIDALELDLAYNRDHKRYLLRALEWDNGNRSNSFLLTGDEISTAETWLSSGASKNPPPTELHGEYIQASRKLATRRQRMLFTGISIALAVSVILTIISLIGFQRATAAEAEAYAARDAAQDARAQAERSSDVSKSLALAAGALQPDNESIKVRLALEATQIEDPPKDVLRTLMITAYEPGTRHNFMIPNVGGVGFMGGAEGKLSVYSGGYSPDGETVVIENKLYDLETGAVLLEFKDAPAVPVVAEFTPDGQRVVIAGDRAGFWVTDEAILSKEIFMGLYDATTGELLLEYDTQSAIVRVQISADGTQLAATHYTDFETFIYDLETGEQLGSVAFASNAVALTSDFSRIASREDLIDSDGFASSIIRVTDPYTGEIINEISTGNLFADLLRFSLDGETIYMAGGGQLLAYSVSDGALMTIFDVANRNSIQSIELSPDGQSIVGVQSTQINVWDVQSGNLLQTFDAHSDRIVHANFAGNSEQIVSIDALGNVNTWDLPDGAFDSVLYVDSEAVFNKTTNEIIMASDDITRIDIDTLETTVISAEFPPDTRQIAYFPEQDWFIFEDTTQSNVLYAIDATSGDIISSVSFLVALSADDDNLNAVINGTRVDLLPDMQHIIVWFNVEYINEDGESTATNVYALWDVYSNELSPTAESLVSSGLYNNSMKVHPDGTLYVMGSGNGENVIIRFDFETQQILNEFALDTDSIGFDFSPDGTQLVEFIAPFVGNDSTIKIRDAFTGEVLNSYPSTFECCDSPVIDWTNGYVQSFVPGGGRGGGGIIGQSLGVSFGGVAATAFTADLETGAVLKEYDTVGWFLGFTADGSRFVVENWPELYIVRNDNLASLIDWTCENRSIPLLTDDQLQRFNLTENSPICEAN